MQTAQDILNTKGHDVYSVTPETTVYDAIRTMADKEIGSLLVMDGEHLVGIVTERDYARKVVLEGLASRDVPVRDIMTTRVLCASPDRTIEECMALMSDKRARHLPVLDHKKVVGVISIGDLVKAIIHEQQFLIDQLQHYIAG